MLKDNLRAVRKGKGLTQKEVADKLGMSDARYNQYETGKRVPDYETLLRLAEFLNVNTSFLLDEGIFRQRDLISKLREPIILAVNNFLGRDFTELISAFNEEKFLYVLSAVVQKIEYDKESNNLSIYYYFNTEPGHAIIENDNDTFRGSEARKDSVSIEAPEKDLLIKYRNLDEHGKEAVNAILSVEFERVKHLEQTRNRG